MSGTGGSELRSSLLRSQRTERPAQSLRPIHLNKYPTIELKVILQIKTIYFVRSESE